MVIFLLNYLGCNFVIVESVESVTLIMVDFIAARTAPQQLGPTGTVEVQLLGCLLRAALLHPCHFRVGGPLPEFHQSLPWSELMAIGRRIAIADHGVLVRRGAATGLISSPQPSGHGS